MKISFTILLLLLSNSIQAQLYDTEPRELRLWENTGDTIREKLKRDRTGNIKILHQEYIEVIRDTTYSISEYFKKDKYWFIFRFKECLLKVNNDVTSYELKQHGSQYSLNPDGTIFSQDDYAMDIIKRPTQYFIYYPDGKLKYVAETNKSKIMNFISYYYPNGDIYDYGNFGNGIGTFTHLNDKGEPCTECTFKDGENFEKKLCADDIK